MNTRGLVELIALNIGYQSVSVAQSHAVCARADQLSSVGHLVTAAVHHLGSDGHCHHCIFASYRLLPLRKGTPEAKLKVFAQQTAVSLQNTPATVGGSAIEIVAEHKVSPAGDLVSDATTI